MKKIAIGIGIGVLALPLAAVVTLLLLPFWRWLEAQTQIESVGHSGPAEWCFGAIYVLALLASFGAWFLLGRKRSGKAP
jgi:hypothetical protein